MPVVWEILKAPSFWGAIIGFIGVMITMWRNAVLQRRGDQSRFDQQVRIDQMKTEHDATVLRTALRAELRQLLNMIYAQAERAARTTLDKSFGTLFDVSQLERSKWIKQRIDEIIVRTLPKPVDLKTGGGWRDNGSRIPFLAFFSIYEKNLDRLGILTQEEVNALSLSYYRYQHRIGIVISNSVYPDKPISPGTGTGISYDLREFDKRRYLLLDIRDIASAADQAIEEIDKHITVPIPPP